MHLHWFYIQLLFFFNLFTFLAASGLCCGTRALSSCSEQGLLFVAVHGLLTAVASLAAEQQALGTWASVVVVCGLSSCGSWLQSAGSVVVAHGLSCSVARGILPDQGSNPHPLHWQVDSQPLRHQGSPYIQLLRQFYPEVFFQFISQIELKDYGYKQTKEHSQTTSIKVRHSCEHVFWADIPV